MPSEEGQGQQLQQRRCSEHGRQGLGRAFREAPESQKQTDQQREQQYLTDRHEQAPNQSGIGDGVDGTRDYCERGGCQQQGFRARHILGPVPEKAEIDE